MFRAMYLGEFLRKLIPVIINVLGIDCRPLEKHLQELDGLAFVHGSDQFGELLIEEIISGIECMQNFQAPLSSGQ